MTVQNIKLRVPVRFPSRISATTPIKVAKSNGIWTFSFDPSQLSDIVPSSQDQPNEKIIYWNSLTAQVNVISVQELVNLVASQVSSARVVTANTVSVTISDKMIVLNKAGATTINLPAVSLRNPNGLPLEIYDFAGTAGPITINPNGTDSIMGANSAWTVRSGGSAQTGGAVRLTPITSLNGWVIK